MAGRPGKFSRPEDGIRRVVAPNPGPLTGEGTNTYIIGEGSVAIIDPGPNDRTHMAAIAAAMDPSEKVTHILITHSHLDHSPLSHMLSKATDAPICAFGDSYAGRSAVMDYLAASGELGGGEGIDRKFQPDQLLADGEVITGDGWEITALWTPGHFGNHMCFALGDAVFTGDLIMGWATTLVSPPDGDITAFMASCRRMAARDDRIYYPGHGEPVINPAERANWLIEHRLERETQVLHALAEGHSDVEAITSHIYTDVDEGLIPAAQRNVLAHLIDLTSSNRILADGTLGPKADFRLP